jgi:uncharacterized protein DUF3224
MNPILGLFSLLAVLLLVPVGQATSLVPISGGFTTTVNSATSTQFGTTLSIKESFSLTFTGSFVGTTIGTATIIVDTTTGNGIFFGTQTFTGTFDGSSGTLQIAFSASFTGPSFNGQFAVFGGTSGLANVRGQGTLTGIVNVNGSYTGLLTSPN